MQPIGLEGSHFLPLGKALAGGRFPFEKALAHQDDACEEDRMSAFCEGQGPT